MSKDRQDLARYLLQHDPNDNAPVQLTGSETPSELARKLIDSDYVATLADVPRDLLEAEHRELVAENARLQAALVWYADRDNHFVIFDMQSAVYHDRGERARKALGGER